MTERRWLVGVDVGGTFTDVALADVDGALHVCKTPTTPDDPRIGVVAGIEQVLATAGVDVRGVARVVHGTTLATNVILERKGPPVAFVVTAGFADVLRLGREARVEEDRYDLFFTTPEPVTDPALTFEVPERVGADGSVLQPLHDLDARMVAARVAAAEPVAVAVCLLNSYANADHERALAEAIRTERPDAFVVASSEIWPEMREYERAMTTVMCAYVGPVMTGYLTQLELALRERGIEGPLEIMDSSGGVMSASLAARRPVRTLESGGAAGVTAAGLVGRHSGFDDVVSFDMGGTTAKVGIVHDGHPRVITDFQVGGKGSFGATRAGTGYPVKIATVDLAEVGAGGGSIAWIDRDGALRVGPRSAGARPGPASYARGGTEPTVTDANLVLGLLQPSLAGGLRLSVDAAVAALTRVVADPLGVTVTDAARSVHEIVNANMAAAIRLVTVQRGIDPRRFTLVAFGGAGPIHAARLAEMFGIATVAVPASAGVASALGLVGADLRVDLVQTRVLDLEGADPDELGREFARLSEQAVSELSSEPGSRYEVTREADVRYRGQAHHLTLPVADAGTDTVDVDELARSFTARFAESYGIEVDLPLQIQNLRVRVVSVVDKFTPRAAATIAGDARAALVDQREAWFAGGATASESAVYDRTLLRPGDRFAGPAVVVAPDSTAVVPPGARATVDTYSTLLITRTPARDESDR
jgi:N-methylhydantoinase A